MHPSIGNGTISYALGSKVMDMRTLTKVSDSGEAANESSQASHDTANKINTYTDSHSSCTDMSYTQLRKCSRNAKELISAKESIEGAAYDSSSLAPSYEIYLFKNDDMDMNGGEVYDHRASFTKNTQRDNDEHMHCFQISNNADLIMESNAASSNLLHARNSETHSFSPNEQNNYMGSKSMTYDTETINGLMILNAPKTVNNDATMSNKPIASEDRISEWLRTLHQIVVDVVRTDNHLEYYRDAKNMARMSDILAVYAWVDPTTGYCQGMSDLLSPFVILYEDNSDAFWCFVFLMRRMRENFQMEGPTGVLKQLQALWKILELTDSEMFGHLSAIGAESLHFAFRMLLVLFRRELSFDEALCMWEMMWAADFNENIAQQLEGNCPELLVLHLRENTFSEMREEKCENGQGKSGTPKTNHNADNTCSPYSNGLRSISKHPFCGLTKVNFWSRNDQLPVCTSNVSTRNGDDELPVFCVAAILIINRQKIMMQTCSIDDLIKMFNDNMLKINVKWCIRTAIKLRKKYFYKLKKQTNVGSLEHTYDVYELIPSHLFLTRISSISEAFMYFGECHDLVEQFQIYYFMEAEHHTFPRPWEICTFQDLAKNCQTSSFVLLEVLVDLKSEAAPFLRLWAYYR